MSWAEKDKKHIWHPFTHLKTAADPILITKADGLYLYDDKGNKIIDAISSWWVNLHGHSHPYISKKVSEQLFSFEHIPFADFTHQPAIELAERLLSAQSRVDSHKLRKGQLSSDDMGKLIAAGDVLRAAPLFIDDAPQQTMLKIAASARRLKMRNDLRLIVIDYLQLIEPESRRDPRQEQVAQISRRLKFLARELNVPVIALAQVNRGSEDRQDHRPRLSDLRESGSIEQDADTCLLLHRPGKFDGGEDNIIEVIIAKQRNGPTGEVTLAYLKQYMRYENYAAEGAFGLE